MEQSATLVMSGRLEEFRLEDVLQAIGCNPQCTAVELRGADGELRGTIWIERGRVLGAEHGEVRGRVAFFQLFGPAAADLFVVSRLRQPVASNDELGTVTRLLLEAPEELARGSQVIPLPPTARAPSHDGEWDERTVARPVRRGGIALAIASARGGVGRTTIARHLARALARGGHRVILVDAEADAGWLAQITEARSRADVVVVDCPPGLTGIGGEVVAACTHVVGVVRSDRTASTAAAVLEGHIDALAAEHGPELVGIIVNLFDGRSVPSIDAFGRIAADGVPMFETTIPRADVLADEADDEGGALAWLFDALATEVSARSGLDQQADVLTLTAASAGLSWLPR